MKFVLLFSAMAILLLSTGVAMQNPAQPSPDASEGKKVFAAAGCATCHDADGGKKLADGTTLLGRLAKAKDPDQRRQVFLYLKPLIAAADRR